VSWRGAATTTNDVRGPDQANHVVGTFAEAGLHPGERLEERHRVGQDVGADHLADGPQDRLGGGTDHLQAATGGQHQEPEQPVVEESGENARCLQEVEGVPARWGVDDHQVESVVAVEFVERLGRHVLLGPTQGAGDVAVEPIGQDPFDLLVGVGVAPHQPVERRRRVEHHRPELAVGPTRRVAGRVRSVAAPRRDRPPDRAHRPVVVPDRS
jgi:hypothetical protein